MKAIHNVLPCRWIRNTAVFKEQKYEKWKQFTTKCLAYSKLAVLFSKSKSTKNESNSQRKLCNQHMTCGCFQRAKVRKMKAIHNIFISTHTQDIAVFKEQKYEKWKQFTTVATLANRQTMLFSKSKSTKNESNSQLIFTAVFVLLRCFQRAKVRKMKAIHNVPAQQHPAAVAVFKEQKYEKWKQFTTTSFDNRNYFLLFSKSKSTKNESNSQHYAVHNTTAEGCFQRAKVRKMKAIHNCSCCVFQR